MILNPSFEQRGKKNSLTLSSCLFRQHTLEVHRDTVGRTSCLLSLWGVIIPHCTMDNHIGTGTKRKHIYSWTLVLHTCSMQYVYKATKLCWASIQTAVVPPCCRVGFCSRSFQFSLYTFPSHWTSALNSGHLVIFIKNSCSWFNTVRIKRTVEQKQTEASLFLPTVVTVTRKTETFSLRQRQKTTTKEQINTGQIWSKFVRPTQPLTDIFGQSYLLYHLHCRIAVDCCLTSTL